MSTRSYRVTQAVHDGEQEYTKITCPILAVFNEPTPPLLKPDACTNAKAQAARLAVSVKGLHEQQQAFEALGSNAHVVRLKDAHHYLFRTNEEDVLREVNAFIATLLLIRLSIASSLATLFALNRAKKPDRLHVFIVGTKLKEQQDYEVHFARYN